MILDNVKINAEIFGDVRNEGILNKMIIREKNIYIISIELMLLFASMNFQAKFFYFAFGVFITVCLFQNEIKLDNMVIVYMSLSLVMGIYSFPIGVKGVVRHFSYVACYLAGYNLIEFKIEESCKTNSIVWHQENKIRWFIFALAMGSFLHLMLNWSMNKGLNIGRNLPDIWSGEILSATGQASIGCLMVALSVSLILSPRKKIERLFGILFMCLLLGYNLILAGRTLIMMYGAVLVLGVLFIIIANRRMKLGKIIFWTILVVSIIAVLYCNNIGGIKDIIISSNLYQRFFGEIKEINLLDSGRGTRKLRHIENMYKYPFGGLHSRNMYGYAHDLLLDAYDEYGILVFILLIIIIYTEIKDVWIILKSNLHSIIFKTVILCIYSAIAIQFCLEPILSGMPWLFVCFCFLNGCLRKNNIIMRQLKKEGSIS